MTKQANTKEYDFTQDIDDISNIHIVSSLLNVISQTTNMRFAAIARVTDKKWIACSVKDDISFGLKPGDELKLETTLCHEVHQKDELIVIDHVDKDPNFAKHHTPQIYGFQSYISVPIYYVDGSFFGTLCAIDPEPNRLNKPHIIDMFKLFSSLITFHLEGIREMRRNIMQMNSVQETSRNQIADLKIFNQELEENVTQQSVELHNKSRELEKTNLELEAFAFISSHDLQEPLRKIQIFSNLLMENQDTLLNDQGKRFIERIDAAAQKMRTIINDVITYGQYTQLDEASEKINLRQIVMQVQEHLMVNRIKPKAKIEFSGVEEIYAKPEQFTQLMKILVGNAVKFKSEYRVPEVKIISKKVNEKPGVPGRDAITGNFIYITCGDNGIGFEPKYSERIFRLFQKLNPPLAYSGNGTGLTIAKKIVENHDGVVSASSIPGQGTIIHIYIPEHIQEKEN